MFSKLNPKGIKIQVLESTQPKKKKVLKKITKQRLKNIALYYLKRFESSVDNLRTVLNRRVDRYKMQNPEFDVSEAKGFVEEILSEFENLHYLDDARYAEIKISNALQAGKSEKYIKTKLRQKGIGESLIDELMGGFEYDSYEMALRLARKKKIGPFREDEQLRRQMRQKDMGVLLRAGFDYDAVMAVLNADHDEVLATTERR